MENLKSNFRLFWNDKKNCSWEIIRPFNWKNCQNECLPIFTKVQCTCFFLFIVAQYSKMSYWHRNYVTNLIYFQFYFIFRLGQIFGMNPMTSVVPRLQLQYPGIHKVRALLDQKSRIFFKIRTIRIPDVFFPGRRTFKL